METIPFIEYRCACGKLLFKGAALQSPLQVKCKRCGVLVPFGPAASEDGAVRYGLLVDGDYNIKGVSESAPKVLGYSREELLSMNASALLAYRPGHGLERFVELAGLPIAFDQAHLTKSGEVLQVRARVLHSACLSEGCALYLFEVRAAEQGLLHDAPETGAVRHPLVGELDLAARFSYVSRELGDFLEKESLHLLGTNIFSSFEEEGRSAHLRWFMEMARARSAYSIPQARLEGEGKVAQVFFTPLYRDDGLLRGYAVAFVP